MSAPGNGRKAGGSKFWLSIWSVAATVVVGLVAGLLGIEVPGEVYVSIAGINGGHALGNVGEYFGKAAHRKAENGGGDKAELLEFLRGAVDAAQAAPAAEEAPEDSEAEA
jgi:hypothetical protein